MLGKYEVLLIPLVPPPNSTANEHLFSITDCSMMNTGAISREQCPYIIESDVNLLQCNY